MLNALPKQHSNDMSFPFPLQQNIKIKFYVSRADHRQPNRLVSSSSWLSFLRFYWPFKIATALTSYIRPLNILNGTCIVQYCGMQQWQQRRVTCMILPNHLIGTSATHAEWAKANYFYNKSESFRTYEDVRCEHWTFTSTYKDICKYEYSLQTIMFRPVFPFSIKSVRVEEETLPKYLSILIHELVTKKVNEFKFIPNIELINVEKV